MPKVFPSHSSPGLLIRLSPHLRAGLHAFVSTLIPSLDRGVPSSSAWFLALTLNAYLVLSCSDRFSTHIHSLPTNEFLGLNMACASLNIVYEYCFTPDSTSYPRNLTLSLSRLHVFSGRMLIVLVSLTKSIVGGELSTVRFTWKMPDHCCRCWSLQMTWNV